MDNKTIATAGNIGEQVRSDCFVQIELTHQNGIQIELISKVASIYGESIKKLIEEVFSFFEIQHAKIELSDKGALPWVITARLESALKNIIKTDKDFLPNQIAENATGTSKDRFRFSRLYLPGNTPSMFLNAGLHKPEGIILDLEDAVSPSKKDEARILVRNALRACNFYGAERMVRINQGERGLADLDLIIPQNPNIILIPKIENTNYIRLVEEKIDVHKEKNKLKNEIYLMPIIESAMGIEMAFEIAKSSKKIIALAIGLEDYTADIGVKRTKEGAESLYARTRLINACHAAKIQPIDSVFSDVGDMDGLLENVRVSKALGFEGMGCIHPRQVSVIQKGFAPTNDDIEKGKKIVFAAKQAEQKGLGVVSLGTKMIDPPVVKRHMKNINLAIDLGLLEADWENKME